MATNTTNKASEVKAWINGRNKYELEETVWNWICKRWPDLDYKIRLEIYDKVEDLRKMPMEHRELWQDSIMVAAVSAPTAEQADREIQHYAMMYRQDGPVEIRTPVKRRRMA